MAGLAADVSLFPLDTLKTRLQAPQGFKRSGGFNGVYKGIGPQVLGSAPQAALFFCTYESVKHFASPHVSSQALPLVHMLGASLGEVVACIVRVPMEVVKQRRQTSSSHNSSWKIAYDAYSKEGFFKGLYRGFGSTVLREVPFSFIQLPILEYLKNVYRIKLKNNINLEPWEVANCGAVAGGISAGLTTPLDVVKTRIMLAERSLNQSLRYGAVWKEVYVQNGIKGLFAGFVPRVMWITVGGYIFFGMYDYSKNLCNTYLLDGAELED
ncbi:PREDICTED: S-adenosylmethionine mitochondrial carrier protein homolog isoform X2 [Nicrophorus vespilloides]|nr:PREDICTED: S-adenosylmethionine mitochondrial carrier protein homolog isoform X2 [Nicrophorus vespilloides]